MRQLAGRSSTGPPINPSSFGTVHAHDFRAQRAILDNVEYRIATRALELFSNATHDVPADSAIAALPPRQRWNALRLRSHRRALESARIRMSTVDANKHRTYPRTVSRRVRASGLHGPQPHQVVELRPLRVLRHHRSACGKTRCVMRWRENEAA